VITWRAVVRNVDPGQASVVGGRVLEAFADTPRLNRWLYSKVAPHVRGEVLEIGSGIGNMSGHIIERAERAVLTDMEPHYLERLSARFASDRRVTVARFDLDAAPPPEIAERRFDAIVAMNVIEHIEDDQRLVTTLANLLKPGGKLLIYVPACPFAYGALDRALGHYRRYTPETLAALLARAGLEAQWPTYVNVLGLLGWMVNGRVRRKEHLSARQVALFERLVPLLRLEDHVRLPIGLGLHATASKPG
jgi:SAM-dependent methyltransferase